MATLILLNKTELPKGTPSEALVAVWDKGSVPDGQISIPVELNERLLPIRDDLRHGPTKRAAPGSTANCWKNTSAPTTTCPCGGAPRWWKSTPK